MWNMWIAHGSPKQAFSPSPDSPKTHNEERVQEVGRDRGGIVEAQKQLGDAWCYKIQVDVALVAYHEDICEEKKPERDVKMFILALERHFLQISVDADAYINIGFHLHVCFCPILQYLPPYIQRTWRILDSESQAHSLIYQNKDIDA